MKQIVITGSESYIGTRLKLALDPKKFKIFGVDIRAQKDKETIEADIRSDSIAAIIPKSCDAVIHLAALSRDKDCKANPCLALQVNVEGTQRVIDACVTQEVKQLIFASTEWVYGDVESGGIQLESQPLVAENTQNIYAATKLMGEQLCRFAFRDFALTVTILRLGIVYGPRTANERQFSSAVESLFYKMESDDRLEVGSTLTSRRFIHVDDLCRAIGLSIGHTGFDILNISGDHQVTLGEIIETGSRLLDKSIQVLETAADSFSIRNPDNSKAKSVLGWEPQVELVTGLRSLMEQR